MAAASASGRCGGTSTPVSPGTTRSETALTAVATTGMPQIMASTIAVGSPPYRLGRTKISNAGSTSSTSARWLARHHAQAKRPDPAADTFGELAAADPDAHNVRPAKRQHRGEEVFGRLLIGHPPTTPMTVASAGRPSSAPASWRVRRACSARSPEPILAVHRHADRADPFRCDQLTPYRLSGHHRSHAQRKVGEPELRAAADRHIGPPTRHRLELVEREAVEGVHDPGYPAGRAATRPTRPAFAQWVCTTSKFRSRNIISSRRSASRSLRGVIAARSEGSTMTSSRMPRRRASRVPVTITG